MAIHDNQPGAEGSDPPGSTGDDRAELRAVADSGPVTEPTIRVPVPAPGWIVIVAGTAERASAAELPRSAFRDPALTRLLRMLDEEMNRANG
jgi:hypothetical protein